MAVSAKHAIGDVKLEDLVALLIETSYFEVVPNNCCRKFVAFKVKSDKNPCVDHRQNQADAEVDASHMEHVIRE